MQRTREGSEGNMTRRQNDPLVLRLLFLRPKTAALLLLLLLLLFSWSSSSRPRNFVISIIVNITGTRQRQICPLPPHEGVWGK